MGRQRNNPQSKGKEETQEKKLNKIKGSNLSDIEYKIMVIRMLKELSENDKKIYRNYKELSGNHSSMKKDIEIMKNTQEEIKNTMSEIKNILQVIKNRLDEAEDQISEMEDKVEKKYPVRATNQKKTQKECGEFKGASRQHET